MMVSCICGHVGVWVEWSSIGRTDASFVFTLTDADILSCLLSLRFAALYPSHRHAPSLHHIVTHWCVHSPSLCISPLLCLLLVLVLVSVARVPRHSSTLFSSSPPPVPSCHPPTSITYTFHLPISSFLPPLSLHSAGPSLSLTLPSSLLFPAVPPFIPAFSVRTPPSSSSPPPVFVPNLSAGSYVGCSVKSATGAAMEAQNECWWLCLFCKVVLCCDLVRRRCFSLLYKVLRRWVRRSAPWVCAFLCTCVTRRSQAGRETTGPGCTPKA